MAVVRDAGLSIDAKRSILIDWAWAEYLIDQATNERMPEVAGPPAFTRSSWRCWRSSAAPRRRRARRL
ncbi:hypothetical protein [Bradyrhizobium sp. CB3481]|uniref:hypothetical protein n=1 Tax=Bradyrhizobium sp. CB3481 TaxID=3039158 RepID=UPI0024B0BF05|nr:hypothetical protein [Bradyrhizobium sp. CB3481]WFU19963.1 hypothetical protein QA643_17360 [Bradyrhizobium sp. CB3481]